MIACTASWFCSLASDWQIITIRIDRSNDPIYHCQHRDDEFQIMDIGIDRSNSMLLQAINNCQ